MPLPTIETQKKISSILIHYDSLLENNRRRIQLLEQSAHLLYMEWFVYLRFPGHEHVRIIDNWREKEATRDTIRVEIHNCLYNDATGLPESYTEDEISQKTDIVFAHIFRLYNTANPEIYEVA